MMNTGFKVGELGELFARDSFITPGEIRTSGSLSDMFFNSKISPCEASTFKDVEVDAYETSTEYVILMDAVGCASDDGNIGVSVEKYVLNIHIKEDDSKINRHNWLLQNRKGRESNVNITLPSDSDLSKISATVSNGLLTVTVAKKKESRPRVIKVN